MNQGSAPAGSSVMGLNAPFNSPFVEPCSVAQVALPSNTEFPSGYFPAPLALIDSSQVISSSNSDAQTNMYQYGDGRLIPELRALAAAADPYASLATSVLYFFLDFAVETSASDMNQQFTPTFALDLTNAINQTYAGAIPNSVGLVPGVLTANKPEDFRTKATAYADLSVSGRTAQGAFLQNWLANPPPGQLTSSVFGEWLGLNLQGLIRSLMTAQPFFSMNLNGGDWNGLTWGLVTRVLERAMTVLGALIGAGSAASQDARLGLGYIGVSGEDDLPAGPVNVPRLHGFAQFTTDVQTTITLASGPVLVNTISTRFIIGTTAPINLSNQANSGLPFPLPPPFQEVLAAIGDNSLFIVFLHGHMSRIEEGADLIPMLLQHGTAANQSVTVIAMDYPGMGYATCPLDDGSTFATASDIIYPQSFPHLDYIEAFIDAFVQTIGLPRVDVFVGGSLGGHMGVRLAKRNKANIVVWSPISVSPSITQLPAGIGKLAEWTMTGLSILGITIFPSRIDAPETPASRLNYFQGVFTSDTVPLLLPPQPVQWYRGRDWINCKSNEMSKSCLDRREVYRPAFRLWHWRTAYECILFSFLDIDPATAQPRWADVVAPIMFCAGSRDNFCPTVDLFLWTNVLATLVLDKGISPNVQTMFPLNTGHSIHNERPGLLAAAVLSFAGNGEAIPNSSQLATPWNDTTCLKALNTIVSTDALLIQAQVQSCTFNISQNLSKIASWVSGTCSSCQQTCSSLSIFSFICTIFYGGPCCVVSAIVGLVAGITIVAVGAVAFFICQLTSILTQIATCLSTLCDDLSP